MADDEKPAFRHRRVPIALASATVLVGLLAIRAWDADLVGPGELPLVGLGIALGLGVVALERQELALLVSLGGQLRGSVAGQLLVVFALLALVTVLTLEFGVALDLVAFAGLATVTLGELALLARETP